MKKVALLLLFASISLEAHHPAINYALIAEWCAQVPTLTQKSLQTLATYLEDLHTFAACCVHNPTCFSTQEGKVMQQKLDEDITTILHTQELIPVYEHFTMLIKEEVGGDIMAAPHARTKEYEILADVAQGCLDYIKARLI